MDAHIRKVYIPMTETGFYILLCLQKPNHGYGIVQLVDKMTDGEIRLAPGTMYGSLSKMEKDGVIRFLREREIVHFQRFGETLRRVQEDLDSKNFYAFNPAFDKKCFNKGKK